MTLQQIEKLRKELDLINDQLLELLNRRAEIVQQIGRIKKENNLPFYDPEREQEMFEKLTEKNSGPFSDETIVHLFKEIAKASLKLQEKETEEQLLVSREMKKEDTKIVVGDLVIGGKIPVMIAGPCAVESREQMKAVASELNRLGVSFLRGGAFKPRTSPYSFQGLGREGLRLMREVADEYGMKVVSEVMSAEQLELAEEYVDIFQIGARNMQNFELLKEVGNAKKPVLLKRGFMATLEELMLAAEYIYARGNTQIILCERGIRTFEHWTRNTLDLSAVPILKLKTHLPVIVDVSHSTGRKDIILPISKAALAAGADGLMVEVHNNPAIARSDAHQQLNLEEFASLMEGLGLIKKNKSGC
ncbi:chorismate mutase [Anoxybacter fermentans]|uniref:Chorismate mutase n=1 Tax=Anoxybacter fermentans TaxID=1323375 RepID=A0A3Q9HRV8_9FIRM|nr:bifunctional 3-deoxy-7-phosphoheptulonate synthase/chorismate mutase [Anoxybacter fermentans]AZR74253.1 chorismate mutase [Anoxybacter fermentans]